MFGLAVILVLTTYLIISIGVVCFAIWIAHKRGIKGWKLGIPAGIVMYLLVFWDQMPVYVMHKYYCIKDGGFTVYKTLDEWKQENPTVIETLNEDLAPNREQQNGHTKYWTTQRFYTSIDQESENHHFIDREEKEFFDAITGEILARSVNYIRGPIGLSDPRGTFPLGWGNYLFILGNNRCEINGEDPSRKFNKYRYSYILAVRGINR